MGPYTSIAVLLVLGTWNVWCSRAPRLQANPAVVMATRHISLTAVRKLLLTTGVLMLLLGLFGLLMALSGSQGS